MHLEYCMYIILSNLFIPILGGSELDWNRLNNCLYLRISEFSGHFFDQVPSLVLLVLDKYPSFSPQTHFCPVQRERNEMFVYALDVLNPT